jgi:hypothetical protein
VTKRHDLPPSSDRKSLVRFWPPFPRQEVSGRVSQERGTCRGPSREAVGVVLGVDGVHDHARDRARPPEAFGRPQHDPPRLVNRRKGDAVVRAVHEAPERRGCGIAGQQPNDRLALAVPPPALQAQASTAGDSVGAQPVQPQLPVGRGDSGDEQPSIAVGALRGLSRTGEVVPAAPGRCDRLGHAVLSPHTARTSYSSRHRWKGTSRLAGAR